jgi:cell division protein FtsW
MKEKKVDKFFLIIVGLLLTVGVTMFISASLGILAKNNQLFYSVLFSQLVLGLGLGLVGMYFCSKINYKLWRRFSLFIFLISILITAAVFIPHLGFRHGGAQRWIELFGFSFQPVEFLKFGFVIYFAAWLSWVKNRVQDFRFGILPFSIMLAIIAIILLKQPDTKSFILISVTGISMLFISGVPMKYILGVAMGGILMIHLLIHGGPLIKFNNHLSPLDQVVFLGEV